MREEVEKFEWRRKRVLGGNKGFDRALGSISAILLKQLFKIPKLFNPFLLLRIKRRVVLRGNLSVLGMVGFRNRIGNRL